MVNKTKLALVFCATVLLLSQPANADCPITAFGAVPNDGIDDRVAAQAAIDMCGVIGGDVLVPAGVFDIGRAGGGYYGLQVRGVTLRGVGVASVLKQTPGIGASVRLLRVMGSNAVIRNLALDGNKAAQTVNEHRHGIFVDHGENTLVYDVVAYNFTGDGYYVYTGSTNTVFRRVRAFDNERNGITFGGGDTNFIEVHDSEFTANRVQQVDSEGGSTNDVLIRGCLLDAEGGNDYAMTVSGSSNTRRSYRWRVQGNEIRGGVYVVWADSVEIRGNYGVNPTTKPSVQVNRLSTGVTITENVLTMTQTTIPYSGVIRIEGTGPTDMPTDILIASNVLQVAHADRYVIRATGAVRVVSEFNIVRGVIFYRTTIPSIPSSGSVRYNLMSAYVEGYSGTAAFDPPTAVVGNLLVP